MRKTVDPTPFIVKGMLSERKIHCWIGEILVRTKGEMDVIDITDEVRRRIEEFEYGLVNVFVEGSTAAITTMEYEEGLVKDLGDALERLAPSDADYKHHLRWNDDNGRSHVRAAMLGPSITVPIRRYQLVLGRWQQIVLVELDTRPRDRRVIVTVMGK
ncbi:MAG: secondary thiamine-phosphate synthase enzyme YjbQ [Thermoplasmata archaeon]|nr:secondary thiamine-phosphate synthase enzyme YjbQ [Thermoplasmata archaeon]